MQRRNYIDALLAKFDIVGTCELGADAVIEEEMGAAAKKLRDGYKSCFAHGARAKTGMALLVSNRLPSVSMNVLYRDSEDPAVAVADRGHTLIATVDVQGRLPLLIVLSHAPPD